MCLPAGAALHSVVSTSLAQTLACVPASTRSHQAHLQAAVAGCTAHSCAPLPLLHPAYAVTKTATIVPEFLDEEVHIFKPLAALTQAVVKIATEPLNPSELPKMVGFSGTNWFWC